MRKVLLRRCALVLLPLALAWQSAWCSETPARPSTEEGLIDGHPALAMWPILGEKDTLPSDPTGYFVHLIPHRDQQREVSRPAGEWFLLDEPGFYRWFLEGAGMISKAQHVVFWGLGSGERGLRMLDQVVPAGLVALDPDIPIKPGCSVHLYSVGGRFLRPVKLSSPSKPIQMPPGPVLALLHDDAKNEWLAVARVTEARPDRPGIVAFRTPAPPAADLFVRVVVEGAVLDESAADATAALTASGTQHRPDVVFHDPSGVYAAWWGLTDRTATVHVAAKGVLPFDQEVALPSGALRYVDGRVSPGSTLTVALELPEGLASPGMSLRVLDGTRVLQERQIVDVHSKLKFPNMPRHLLHLVLRSGVWKVNESVDMSDGEDREVALAPPAIHVAGTVTRCGKPAAVEVGFLSDGTDFRWASTKTDQDGHYAATVFHPITLLKFTLPGTSDLLEPLNRAIAHDTTRDFELPCNQYLVHVTDARTGSPVADAKVGILNNGERAGASAESRTNSDGEVKLHPLRPGNLTLTVLAEGYEKASVKQEVPKEPTEKVIDVALQPSAPGAKARLLLADGRPASGAEVAGIGPDGATLLWEGTCDGDGAVTLPEQALASALLARHASAGLLVAPWPTNKDETTVVTMPPLGAQRRLIARTADGQPAAWAGVAVWVNGVRLRESALGWATQADPLCGRAGEYRWVGGPLQGVMVVCWTRSASGRVAAGGVDWYRVGWDSTEIVHVLAAQ